MIKLNLQLFADTTDDVETYIQQKIIQPLCKKKNYEYGKVINAQDVDKEIESIETKLPDYEGSNVVYPSASGTTLSTNGKSMTSDINVRGDANLIAKNIREGVTIFGVKGTLKSIPSRRYGVKFNGSSATGTRLFDAVGKNVQVAKTLEEIAVNDFDTDEWFKDITYPYVDGNYMTRFPMCYGKMDFANQEFVIANDSFDGLYDVLPIFKAPNGSIMPYIDIGRFQLGDDYKSKPNVEWLDSQTRAQFRSGVRGLGNQYSQWDIATITFIRVLFMIVLANRNSQQILPCNYSQHKRLTGIILKANSSIVQFEEYTGSFYGLENIVDGGFYFIDGINCNDPYYYVCNDPSKYADDTSSGYTQITNFTEPDGGQYITKMDIDPKAPYASLPSQASGGSMSTYYCDQFDKDSGWRIMVTGALWSPNRNGGLFNSVCFSDSGVTSSGVGSRLVRRPF